MVRGHTGGRGGTHSYHHVSSRVSGGGGDIDTPLSSHSLGSGVLGSAGLGTAGLETAGLGGRGGGHHVPSYHRIPVSHASHGYD